MTPPSDIIQVKWASFSDVKFPRDIVHQKLLKLI